MAVAEHPDNIELQEEDDMNYENERTPAGRASGEMDEEGHYEHLDLQNTDDAIYEDLQTKTKKEKDLHKLLQSDRRRYKRVGVGIGLLVAVLALLNIAIPVHLLNKYNQLLDRNIKLTAERDTLLDMTNNIEDMKMRLCESPGWQKFDRGCYYISTEVKTWAESRKWCTDRLSDLIVIKSKAQQDFVASFNQRVWLGLTDREREGSFQWVDGTLLTTPTYWYPGEPEDNRNPNAEEDCVEYYDGSESSSPALGWNDLRCSASNYWMCERVVC